MSQQPEPVAAASPEKTEVESTPVQLSAEPDTVGPEPAKDTPPKVAKRKEKPPDKQSGISAEFAGEVSVGRDFHLTDIKAFFGNYGAVTFKTFSPDFLTPVSEEMEDELAATHVADGVLLRELYTTLSERHLLVLTGEPETGKTTTALYLSRQVRGVYDNFNGAQIVRPLDRNVKIDFEDITGRKDFGHRLLLFKDAFAGANEDVLNFFAQMGKATLSSLTQKLQDNHLYLIFTADTQTIKRYQWQLSSLNIERCLPALADELLLTGLAKKLTQFSEAQHWTPAELERRLPTAEHARVVKELRTMPRIAHLIDHYLLKLGDEFDLKEAIGRVDYLQDWFLADLANNFDDWCFALALGLCHCVPNDYGVSWFEFEYFREAISKHLRQKLRVDWSERPKPTLEVAISENLPLKRCRAEIYKDPASGADKVRFISDQYPEKLWDIFLKSNRRILSLLLPLLKTIAELPEPRLRARAAAIIGRMGEIDPPYVTLSLMEDWINSGNPAQMATVGYLYQGIWASRNSTYRDECLRRLNNLSLEGDRPEIWAAIAAYKQLGVYDLPLAMEKLKDIAEGQFAETIEDGQRVERMLNRIENRLEQVLEDRAFSDVDSMALAVSHKVLQEIAKRVFSQDSPILFAIQYAIVALSLSDPIRVLDELQKWTVVDRKSMGALVALIFLEYNGIAAELESKMIETPTILANGSRRVYSCNLLVTAMASSDEAVRRTARFLEAIFDSFMTFFPRHSRSYFKKSFSFHLKDWVGNAFPVERLRTAMAQLFDELLLSPNQDLRDLLTNLTDNDSDIAYPESKYFLFKQALNARRMNLQSRPFSLD